MRIKKILCIILSLAAICAPFSGCTPKDEEEPTYNISKIKVDNAKLNEIETQVDDILNRNEFHGSAVISMNNQKIYSKSFGYLDPGKNHKLNSKSQYPIGTLTMGITSAAVLKLEAEKKLSLKDKLSKYFYLKENGQFLNEITIEDLIKCQCAFGNYTSDQKNNPERWAQLERYFKAEHPDLYNEKISELIEANILHNGLTEGTKNVYSNFYLLGRIVAKVTGGSYSKYVQKNIFDKLGMKHTGFMNSRFKICGLDMNNKKWVLYSNNSRLKNFGYLYSTLGIVSCTDDMHKFYTGLLSGKLGVDFVKKIRYSYATNSFGFYKYSNKVRISSRLSYYCAYVNINFQNNEVVVLLSNSIGKTDVVNTGMDMYDVISSKVNGLIIDDVQSENN